MASANKSHGHNAGFKASNPRNRCYSQNIDAIWSSLNGTISKLRLFRQFDRIHHKFLIILLSLRSVVVTFTVKTRQRKHPHLSLCPVFVVAASNIHISVTVQTLFGVVHLCMPSEAADNLHHVPDPLHDISNVQNFEERARDTATSWQSTHQIQIWLSGKGP